MLGIGLRHRATARFHRSASSVHANVESRKAGQIPFLRVLTIPLGRSGNVALFEIEDQASAAILAVRHQLD